jgi:filamentous hemagglutinin family protein
MKTHPDGAMSGICRRVYCFNAWSICEGAEMKANRCRRRRFFRTANTLVSVITLIFFSAGVVFALPAGQQVVNGQASFTTQGGNLTVTNSPNSIINWQGFSINNNEVVRFIQQYGSSAVLNRVIGQDPSRIFGLLQSNGRVFLINPNGILFGQGAKIDVNGLFASTLNIGNQDFLAGKYNFTAGAAAGSIQNQGTITTPEGGKIYLIAPDIENSGIINSPKGDVILAAGHSVQLVDSLNPAISIVVSAPENKAVNLGLIVAQSGKVGIYGGLIFQRGIVNADSAVVGENGRIFFKASKDITLDTGSTTSARGGTIKVLGGMESGTVRVSGTLDASAPNGGDGGFIETSAAHVKVDDSARITTLAPYGKTGTWLIDPYDYTVAASGGDMTGAALSSALGGTDVSILSSGGATVGSGDINVNDAVSWSANTLTLTAARDININAVMTAGASSALVMNTATTNGPDSGVAGGTVKVGFNPGGSFKGSIDFPGRSGTGFLTINGNGYTVINSLGAVGSVTGTDLQGMNGGLAGNYALGSNIDASATSGWNGGAGFVPVSTFTGTFDGLGHTISGLFINRQTDYIGLFGNTSGSIFPPYLPFAIRNVGLVNGNITGNSYVGGLVGNIYSGTISNSYSGGTVTATGDYGGGLVGYNYNGFISNSYSGGTVAGTTNVGGLVGLNYYTGGAISNSYSTGTVTASVGYGGGLVGDNSGDISNSYSTGAVNVTNVTGYGGYGGGLVGYNHQVEGGGTISNSYSTGTVAGSGSYFGGLAGYSYGDISNSYSTGGVNGNSYVGGLVGYNDTNTISNSYSTGAVTGGNNVGGLVGYNYFGTISNSYSTGAVTGGSDVGGLVGYGYGGSITGSFWDNTTAGVPDGIGYDFAASGPSDNGATGLTTAEMMTQTTFAAAGWDIANTGSAGMVWRIYEGSTTPLLTSFLKPLTITAANITKTYDGNPYISALTNPSYSIPGAGSSGLLFNTGNAYNSAVNAGSYTPGLYSTQQGYDIGYVNGLLTINPAVISTIINLSGSRVYDGTRDVAAGIFALGGFIGGQTLTLTGVGTVDDKNVGLNKPVTLGTLTLVDGYGGLASNYTLLGGTHTATITARPLNIMATGVSKAYDGLLSANVLYGDNRVTGDLLSLGGSATYLDKNVGIAKTVNVRGIALTGADAGNYRLNNTTAVTTADITARALIVTAVTNTKGYDGNTSAAATPAITSGSLAGGDTAALTEVYDSKIAGTGKTLIPTAVISDGNGGNNYLVTYVNNTTGVINPGQIISGMLDVAAGGKIIGFVVNGTLLPDQASTNESGNYSWMLPLNSIPDNSTLLAYVAGDGSVKSASVYLSNGGNITNLLLISNTVTASSGGGTMSNATLGIAKGILSSGDIPYSVLGTNLTLSPNFNFKTAGGTSYSLNGNITTTNGAQTYNGPVTLLGNTVISAGTGNISFGGPVTGTGYNFTINSRGMVTQTAPITVGGLELLGTGATYNLTNIGNAITTLAGNTGAVNFVNSTGLGIGTVNTAGLAASGDLKLNSGGAISQSAPLQVTGVATFDAGTTHDITLMNAGNNFSSVGITSGKDVFLRNAGALALNASTASNSLSATAGGNITLNGLISVAGTGNVTLKSGGAIINGMGSSTSISAGSLLAEAVNGIGSGDPLMTGVHKLTALNTIANNIEIDNTGDLTVSGLQNLGAGNVILQNIGDITTDSSPVTSSGGTVSITAHSPLTIGSGGVSASGNISLEAAASGGSDDLTINGNIASSNGNIILIAGRRVVFGPGSGLSAPYGTIILTDMDGVQRPAVSGNEAATGNTISSLNTAMAKIESDEKGDDENERKKKAREGGGQTTDDKKTDDTVKKYCN